jgi:16S rRNA processing protein RimM
VSSREAADELRGQTLTAEPIHDPDEMWVHELIGAHVVETDGTERGVVESVLANPASDVLVLTSGALVPLTFVVDHGPDRIVVEVPPGLFDL